jgi:hypothetical protein
MKSLSAASSQVAGHVPALTPDQRNTQVLSRVKTGDIQVGDIVLEHGMRVRIDEIETYPGGPHGMGTVYACRGTVTNLIEVRQAGIVPRHFLFNEPRYNGGPTADGAREDYWVVQGNDLATWTVERQEA